MKLVIGLGNLGEKYNNTRHNAGWLVLDKLTQEISKSELLISKQVTIPQFENNKKLQSLIAVFDSLVFAKPQTFMNNSGEAVQKLTSFYNIQPSDLWVIHDDLDIKLGQYKIQFGKGPKEHNGLKSIYEKLGTSGFWHIRIGVDNRNPENRELGEKYVLQKFNQEELEILEQTLQKILTELV